jgi:bifunctional DNase/RNase
MLAMTKTLRFILLTDICTGVRIQIYLIEPEEVWSMVEMTIDSIRVSMVNYQRVVILKEKGSERYLPIWIGPAEADAIAVKLQGVTVPRPLTHDLLRTVIDTLGATVDSIVVSDLKNDTFYARIILNVNGRQTEIDSRPSDAMALAVRVEVPIFAEESVLDKASIMLDKETGKPLIEDGETPAEPRTEKDSKGKKVSEEDVKKMSAFYDFINTLDLEDFDKRKS